MNHQKRTLIRLGVFFICSGLTGALWAADAKPADSTKTDSTTSSEPITELAKFTVSEVPIERQILPTIRPIGSVFGDDRSIVDTPRSVTSVNKAWMDDRQIKNAMDFSQFSAGVYSAAQYGIPGVPQMRGDLAQVYVNGQIIPFSRNSTPLSFNGVEAMDIVKGPGSAVYGPQGQGPGGYVNFVPKSPYFDRQHVDTSTTLGYWTSGHSYSNPETTIDFGGPISDKLAYRVSYLGRWGNQYYLNAKDETQDVYAALTYLASKTVKFEWWGQVYADRTNEITGANRVTQAFIDHGTYIGGPTVPVTSGPTAFFGFTTVTTVNAPVGTFGSVADGSFQIVNPATAYKVKLPAYDALVGPSDTARSKVVMSQLKTTIGLSGDASLVNLAFFANGVSNKYETYGYDEFVPKNMTIQDRLSYHTTLTTGTVSHNLITGIDFRYTDLRAYQDFQTEPFTIYDIYQPLSSVYYPVYNLQGQTWGSGLQVPGKPGYSSDENQDTQIKDSALFIQDSIQFTKKFSAVLGARADHISVTTANPPMTQVGLVGPAVDFQYLPISPAIFYPKGSQYNVSTSKTDPSFFGSLVYKANDSQSFYITYDRINAVQGASNFGGVGSGGTFGNPTPASTKNNLANLSTLYEAGYKGSFLKNKLYFSAILFQQVKTQPQLKGAASFMVKDNGLELETVYQPNRALSFNANLTYQDATAFGTGFFQESGNYLDAYATTMTVDGQKGTGIGAVNYTTYAPPTGRMRAPGVPQVLANFFVEYKWPSGFGIGIGPQYTGRQLANDQGTLHIASEYQVDGYLFYRQKTWDARFNVTNITNDRLLDPIDVSFAGNDVVFVRKPISASLTIRFHL